MAPSGPPPANANAIFGAVGFFVLMKGQCRLLARLSLLHRSKRVGGKKGAEAPLVAKQGPPQADLRAEFARSILPSDKPFTGPLNRAVSVVVTQRLSA